MDVTEILTTNQIEYAKSCQTKQSDTFEQRDRTKDVYKTSQVMLLYSFQQQQQQNK